ncbi:MAG: alanine racemase [Patescibacteria group bacterium]|nr:alanine racemase [Patescibacteria group bacterium]
MSLLQSLKKLKKSFSSYQPLIEILIHKDNLLHNYREYCQAYPNLQIAPVLKSNAYGHGLIPVAQILAKTQAPFFVIDSLFEAKQLRHGGISNPLLVIGYASPENIFQKPAKNTAFTITSLDQLKEISAGLKFRQAFHLKIDTGMHRQGLVSGEIPQAVKLIKQNKNTVLEGLCSHLADADSERKDFTLGQIALWKKAKQEFQNNFPGIKYFHLAATSGLAFGNLEANAARLGLGLYGINISPFKPLNLRPVLEMNTIITSVKNLNPGESVGYNITFTAKDKLKVAAIPAGYFEGIDRRLSSKGCVKIGNSFCPIIGRVSMNITSVDVTNVPEIKNGSPVNVISSRADEKNSAENIAKLCGTIPYEILVHLPQHLKRQVV